MNDILNLKSCNKIESHSSLNKEKVLCQQFKRTDSNRICCMGICIADNYY